ncbi:MAG: LysM peptidoglycan-binding domain-containing protein [Flavobacteriales bacterium]|nr:LysM peptidoglycan-binding domain-containing protein [Flavobacteriales bacterium]
MRRFLQHITAALAVSISAPTYGQGAWPVDSLLATWPIQQRFQTSRVKPKPGQTLDADRLYEDLKRATPALPVFVDSLVDRHVEVFTQEQRDHFRVVLGAAEAYLPMIERELAAHGLPDDLKYLPFALSAFNPQAASNTGEAGLWMLTWPVALKHGLIVSASMDERRDAEKCTAAAMRHLQALHARYNDWPTAVMAFACGPANLTRARQRAGRDADARLLYPHFSPGHRGVLPRLMAFTFLARQAEAIDLEPLVYRITEPNDTVRFDSLLHIGALTRVLGTRPSRFSALNPTLTGGTVPAGMAFLLPRSEAARFTDLAFVVLEAQRTKPRTPAAERLSEEAVDRLADGREAILHRIEEGEDLHAIAARFTTSTAELMAWNDLKSEVVEVGNTLIVYVPHEQRLRYEGVTNGIRPDTSAAPVRTDTTRVQVRPPAPKAMPDDHSWYTVRSGDSLYGIAKRHPGVSAEDIMRANGIGANIRPGQRIKIPKP